MDPKGRYEGKVALVTGGASGIGLACCKRLASEGASLAILDRDLAGAEAIAAELAAQGCAAVAIAVDVASSASVESAVGRAGDHFGRLDLVVNNAGIGGSMESLEDVSDELWDRTIGINLSGVFYVMRSAYKAISASGGGAIVNISSILGTVGLPNSAAYVAAKHGVIGLTRSAALNWGPRGVRVVAVCPTFVHTAMTEGMGEEAWQALIAQHALGRLPEADDIAATVAFLGSDDARAVTGSAHMVDAGYTAI